jgi:hypothetical protein
LHGGGAAYSVRDQDIEPGTRYTYWLVEVDNSGQSTVYGPASAVPHDVARYHAYLPLVAR